MNAAVVAALALLATIAVWWCYRNGCILYYGDAESHLNISRSIVDSRTPGYDQLGTVWLPVLHLICLPLVRVDALWSTGLAGALPVALCFVIAGICLFFAAQDVYRSMPIACVVVACFALNPNVLYLAATPMTEIVFLAGLFSLLLALLRFQATSQRRWLALGVMASWFLSLTRYDGWFLIPFAGIWFAAAAKRHKLAVLIGFGVAASLAPLYWVAHNWWETGNALDFYNGPYSPRAIQGSHGYPGYHDWGAALHYYLKAGELCAGTGLLLLGVVGTAFAFRDGTAIPILFLCLTPFFYIWSMHSTGGTPIYVPPLWPFTFYNSRYGLALVPLCALAAGAIAFALPPRWKKLSFLIPILAVGPWLLHPSRQNWICWKESEVNSKDRRAWTDATARFLGSQYRSGQGILTSQSDVTGIYRILRIPLSETVNIGNGPVWSLATTRPDLFHPGLWLVMQEGDSLSKLLAQAPKRYSEVLSITTTRFSPALTISRRNPQ